MINDQSITGSLFFKKITNMMMPSNFVNVSWSLMLTIYIYNYVQCSHFVLFGNCSTFFISDWPALDPLCTVEVQTVRDFTTLTKVTP